MRVTGLAIREAEPRPSSKEKHRTHDRDQGVQLPLPEQTVDLRDARQINCCDFPMPHEADGWSTDPESDVGG